MSSKNLFDYATKELSQDAMLCWLFANYDKKEFLGVGEKILRKFCGLKSDEKITNVEVQQQWPKNKIKSLKNEKKKIDIYVNITLNNNNNVALFIEDKTFSNEHYQLGDYNEIIDDAKNRKEVIAKKTRKVFFKSSFIETDEKERVENAEWTIFDIGSVYNLITNCFNQTCHQTLKDYADFFKEKYKAHLTTARPRSHSKSNLQEWAYYFDYVMKELKEYNNCEVKFAKTYGYVYFTIKQEKSDVIPYFEIQSRDLKKDSFIVRILCYGMQESDRPKQAKLIEGINKSKLFQFKERKTKTFQKQIGCANVSFSDENDFIGKIGQYADEYLELMENYWK